MKRIFTIYISLCASVAIAAEPDAQKLIRTAESIRTVETAELQVQLQTVDSGKVTTDYLMNILRSTGKRAHVEFVSPDEERGRKMLVVQDKYWARFPDSKKVHSISRKEMIGNSVFQLVDLFQIDADKDFEAKLNGETKVGPNDCYRIHLTARSDEAPYASIDYYIVKKDNFPIRAQFFSISGKLIKTLEVNEKKMMGGMVRPSKFTMVDEVTKGRASVWYTKTLEQKRVPDTVFTVDFLARN